MALVSVGKDSYTRAEIYRRETEEKVSCISFSFEIRVVYLLLPPPRTLCLKASIHTYTLKLILMSDAVDVSPLKLWRSIVSKSFKVLKTVMPFF